jgi:DnaB-like helicase N terminal domain
VDASLGVAVNSVSQPPQDQQAEQSVLGGMLLSRTAVADVTERLHSDDFYRPAHQNIYDAILDVHTRSDPVDPVTVAAELDRRGQLRRIGGAIYLHTLISTVPTAANAGYYANIVAEKAALRRLTEVGTRITEYGYSGADGIGVAGLFDRAHNDLQSITNGHRQTEPQVDTWAPIDLGPWLSGDIEPPEPTVGIARTDGLRMIYEGREHAVLGETESGKTWFADGCVAAELLAGNHVVYIHYEEGDPASTIERLRLLGVDPSVMKDRFRFIAPDKPPLPQQVNKLLDPAPTLVIHDGVNEAMSMMGAEIKEAEGASMFRRQLITPFRRVASAVLVCDHLPLAHDPSRKDAFGSVHKGNALDGARIMLVNVEPFGRHMHGSSKVLVTKDRPGQLRSHGESTQHPGITYMGMLSIDDAVNGPDFLMRFHAPKAHGASAAPADDPIIALADLIYAMVALLPDQEVESTNILIAEARKAGIKARNTDIGAAADYLVVTNRFEAMAGKNRKRGFRAVGSSSQGSSE